MSDGDTIRTERLLLRPPRASDAGALFAHLSNWEVTRWLGTPPWPYRLADAESYIALQLSEPPGPTRFLVITLDDAVIGTVIAAGHSPDRPRTPELGYWLAQGYWGRGLMTEAARAYVRRIFSATGIDTIYSGAFTGNDASLRVQEKLGFKRTGESLVFCRPRGARLPHIHTELKRPQLAGCSPRHSP